MSKAKRPEDQTETPAEDNAEAVRDMSAVEDAELVPTPEDAPNESAPLTLPGGDETADRPAVSDADAEGAVAQTTPEKDLTTDLTKADTPVADADAPAVNDTPTGDAETPVAEGEAPQTEPAPTTPWGGAPADISARSTTDPSSPAYVAPVAAAVAAHSDEDYHEDSPSIASRVLFALFLLLAGGVLVLWGGPKIAPNLPAGLAPVAEWLTPGQRAAQMEVEELEARLTARIAALDTGLSAEGIADQISAAVAESEGLTAESLTALTEEVNALSDQVAASDSAPIEERLAQVETRVQGLGAELESLRNDLTGLAAGADGITGQAGRNAAEIDAFTAALAGVRAEIDALAATSGAMDQRIDEVAATSERELRTAREEVAAVQEQAEAQVASAAEQADMIALANALETGAPFEAPLVTLGAQTELRDVLPTLAPNGVSTQVALEERFPELARAAIRAELSPTEDDGLVASASAFLRARVAGRSLVEREGSDADAVLSRVEARLQRGDLGAALDEVAQLSAPASAIMADWTADLRARHDALTAYSALVEQLDAGN